MQALMFGEVSALIYSLNKDTIILTEHIENVMLAINSLNLNSDLKYEVIRYVKTTWDSSKTQQESELFYSLVPTSFQNRIKY